MQVLGARYRGSQPCRCDCTCCSVVWLRFPCAFITSLLCPRSAHCLYPQDWDTSGVVLVGFDEKVVDGVPTLYSLCATTHLTDFSGVTEPEIPQFNMIDPIGDAGLLGKVLDPGNLFPFIAIVTLTGVMVLGGSITGYLDRYRSRRQCVCIPNTKSAVVCPPWHDIAVFLTQCLSSRRRRESVFEALREEHFIRYGEIVPGPGKEFIHLAPDNPERVRDARSRREKCV